jgi:hypothetical protein
MFLLCRPYLTSIRRSCRLQSLQLRRASTSVIKEHYIRCINFRRTHSFKNQKQLKIFNIPVGTKYSNTNKTLIKIHIHDGDITTSNPKGLLIVRQLLVSLPGPEISLYDYMQLMR